MGRFSDEAVIGLGGTGRWSNWSERMLTPHRRGTASGDGPAKAQGGISAGRRHISREAAYQPWGGISAGRRHVSRHPSRQRCEHPRGSGKPARGETPARADIYNNPGNRNSLTFSLRKLVFLGKFFIVPFGTNIFSEIIKIVCACVKRFSENVFPVSFSDAIFSKDFLVQFGIGNSVSERETTIDRRMSWFFPSLG